MFQLRRFSLSKESHSYSKRVVLDRCLVERPKAQIIPFWQHLGPYFSLKYLQVLCLFCCFYEVKFSNPDAALKPSRFSRRLNIMNMQNTSFFFQIFLRFFLALKMFSLSSVKKTFFQKLYLYFQILSLIHTFCEMVDKIGFRLP